MSVWFVTGKLGQGKSKISVQRIIDYVQRGRPIATNLDLFPEHFNKKNNRDIRIIRLPDKPSAIDLHYIGSGNETYDEDLNGLVVLDECGTWFNSRTWNDKDRKGVIDWFLHARKLGWDVIFIIQDISIIDKQARETLCEHLVFCRRLDKIAIPFLTAFSKLFHRNGIRFPKAHIAFVKYGDTVQHPTTDRWFSFGSYTHKIYDTKQVFMGDRYQGNHSLLTPWHLIGRYQKQVDYIKEIKQAIMQSIKYSALTYLRIYCLFTQQDIRKVALNQGYMKGTPRKYPSRDYYQTGNNHLTLVSNNREIV
jgi:Zonular occludens toxin (Zot)